jgi:hypothetical protein
LCKQHAIPGCIIDFTESGFVIFVALECIELLALFLAEICDDLRRLAG